MQVQSHTHPPAVSPLPQNALTWESTFRRVSTCRSEDTCLQQMKYRLTLVVGHWNPSLMLVLTELAALKLMAAAGWRFMKVVMWPSPSCWRPILQSQASAGPHPHTSSTMTVRCTRRATLLTATGEQWLQATPTLLSGAPQCFKVVFPRWNILCSFEVVVFVQGFVKLVVMV